MCVYVCAVQSDPITNEIVNVESMRPVDTSISCRSVNIHETPQCHHIIDDLHGVDDDGDDDDTPPPPPF